MLDSVLRSKSPLPQWDMICEFMWRKSNSSIEVCTIVFAHTTTPISLNWTLEFFEMNSIPSSFLLVATPLPFLATSSIVKLNLFATNHACENPFNPCLVKIIKFHLFSRCFTHFRGWCPHQHLGRLKMGPFFLSGSFRSKFLTPFLFKLYHFWQVVKMNKLHPHYLLMMAALIFHQIFLAFEACFSRAKYGLNFGGEPMFNGINFQSHVLFLIWPLSITKK